MLKQLLAVVAALLLGTGGIRAQSVKFLAPNPVVRSITLSTGVTLQYVEQGDRNGTPVILLHGFTDSWHSWELVLPELPGSLHVFALSQRGHGSSDKPATGYDPRDFAQDVIAFLDQQKIRSAVIVGHSMGSIIAQRLAIDHPTRTQGLMLAGSFASLQNNEAIQGFQQVLDTLQDPVSEQFAREFQESTIARPVEPGFIHTAVKESLKVPARVWKAVGAALFKADYLSALKAYNKPAWIVWGDKDVFSPRADQDQLVRTLAGAQLLVYDATGHAVHWEQPARFAADLLLFVQSLKP